MMIILLLLTNKWIALCRNFQGSGGSTGQGRRYQASYWEGLGELDPYFRLCGAAQGPPPGTQRCYRRWRPLFSQHGQRQLSTSDFEHSHHLIPP